MREFQEACGLQRTPPSGQPVIAAEAITQPALLVASARIQGKEDAPHLEGSTERTEYAWQVVRWNVKERRAREDAVEVLPRQAQLDKVLPEHPAAGVGPGHGYEARGAIDAKHPVSQAGKVPQVTPRPAAQIEKLEGAAARKVAQEQGVVRRKISMAGVGPVLVCHAIVSGDRQVRSAAQVLCHGRIDSNSQAAGRLFFV